MSPFHIQWPVLLAGAFLATVVLQYFETPTYAQPPQGAGLPQRVDALEAIVADLDAQLAEYEGSCARWTD